MERKIIGIVLSLMLALNGYSQRNNPVNYQISPIHMQSRWANKVNANNALVEYPRPQLERKNWENLNGLWDYTITDSSASAPSVFEGKILVPYPIESALSGVQKKLMPDKCLWYRKILKRSILKANERIILNFGAVDWQATIFINKKMVGKHSGGYQGFSFDITNFTLAGDNEILVKVFDPSDKGPNPHGKQVLNPENIYYTSSSGIWQTVWLEIVGSTYISHLKTTPNIDSSTLNLSIDINGDPKNTMLEVSTLANGRTVSIKKIQLGQSHQNNNIHIPNPILWSPDTPFLYDLSIKLIKNNKTIDEIRSYFGMRKVSIEKDEKGIDRIFLNNKYTFNLGVLDQGFWPEGLYTAPADEAMSFDIKTIKTLGFNTIRKHIKIEPDRWYFHADKIGILVWQDFVNPPPGLPKGSRQIFEREVEETMEQLHNHPCIITWVLFNERWGTYDQERLTKWVKEQDPSRLVNGHSGELLYVDNQLREPATNPWVGSDMTDVHSYPDPRDAPALPNKARVIGEFGGIGVPVPGHEWDDMQGWGYIQANPSDFKLKYNHMMEEIRKLEKYGLSASIYTQPFDVEGEENGILTYDREIIKIPINEIRAINREMVTQTNGFRLDSNFVIASEVNENDNDSRYEELLGEYIKGTTDSAFLRRLVLISVRKKDQEKTTTIGNDYIDGLTHPFSRDNIEFIRRITKTSRDKGFKIFLNYPEKVDSVLGENVAALKVKSIIDAEEIAPYTKTSPDWATIQQRVVKKYGNIGEELVLGKQMIYYGFEAPNKDWREFGKYYMLYFEKALTHPEYYINNISWTVFKNVSDPNVLQFAVGVMRYAIEKWDHSPEAYDTYAQLLHKTNKSSEAIKWEEKALELKKGAPDEKLYAETLQKMKSGLPTWPQNN